MNPSALGIAFLVGALLPLQALVNARLGQLTFGPLFAALASFTVGTLLLAAIWLANRPALTVSGLQAPPWWAWAGGAIGAVYVVAATALVPRLGTAALICLMVFGQLVGSLLLDHFGVLHARQPVDVAKLLGVVLVAAGVLLVVRPWQAR